MPEIVQFHFLLLAAGECLKHSPTQTVTAQDIQNYIQNDDAFGVRVPLDQCRLALELLENSGFIIRMPDTVGIYERRTIFAKLA
jgi:hypothetical protein